MNHPSFGNAFRPLDYITRAEAIAITGLDRSRLQRLEKKQFFIKEIGVLTPVLRKHRFPQNGKDAYYELAQIKELKELLQRQQAALARRQELYGV